MLVRSAAILCANSAHGEHGAVIRALTADHGLVAAYVAGARGRTLRPVLIPGNRVALELHARGDSRLPAARVELVASRAPWLVEPLPAAAIGWATALTAATLPERHPYPALHAALEALLEAVCVAPSARGWVPGLIAFEALLLREVGYGSAAVSGADEDFAAQIARLDRQGEAIAGRLLADRRRDVMAARTILLDRLRRIAAG